MGTDGALQILGYNIPKVHQRTLSHWKFLPWESLTDLYIWPVKKRVIYIISCLHKRVLPINEKSAWFTKSGCGVGKPIFERLQIHLALKEYLLPCNMWKLFTPIICTSAAPYDLLWFEKGEIHSLKLNYCGFMHAQMTLMHCQVLYLQLQSRVLWHERKYQLLLRQRFTALPRKHNNEQI